MVRLTLECMVLLASQPVAAREAPRCGLEKERGLSTRECIAREPAHTLALYLSKAGLNADATPREYTNDLSEEDPDAMPELVS